MILACNCNLSSLRKRSQFSTTFFYMFLIAQLPNVTLRVRTLWEHPLLTLFAFRQDFYEAVWHCPVQLAALGASHFVITFCFVVVVASLPSGQILLEVSTFLKMASRSQLIKFLTSWQQSQKFFLTKIPSVLSPLAPLLLIHCFLEQLIIIKEEVMIMHFFPISIKFLIKLPRPTNPFCFC